MMTLRPALRFWIILAIVPGCGSGSRFGDVEGVVRLHGAPVSGIRVSFLPDPLQGNDGRPSSAVTDEGGHYRLSYDGEPPRDGALVGWHRVVFRDAQAENARGDPRLAVSRVPRAYADPSATPLKFEVKPGQQTIDLDIQP